MRSGRNVLAEIRSGRVKLSMRDPNEPWLDFNAAYQEIMARLALPADAATALLYGLCVTGKVLCRTTEGVIIDPDETTMGNVVATLDAVSETDFRDWLRGVCNASSPRDDEIKRRFRAGEMPPDNIEWNPFCDGVRDNCNGWRGKGRGRARWGFGDKQIKRRVKELRQQWDI
jgi:hypothetical protein